MQPFKLTPAYKDYLWGGTRLAAGFGKTGAPTPLAESWELSAHPDGESTVADGPFAGTGLAQLYARHPGAFGSRCAGQAVFPILIKLIDAEKPLSIQVHPQDAYAQKVEGEPGKTEMWVVLQSAPGAFIYYGFEQKISREEFARRIGDGTLEEVLHKAPVKPGDVFFIAAGTLHAIGAGILLAEVQQNSNTTYRVYDYGRTGPDGAPRQLHIEKALDVTDTAPAGGKTPGAEAPVQTADHTLQHLAACPYFTVRRLSLHGRYGEKLDGGSFVSLLCTAGSATLTAGGEALPAQKGDSLLVPADLPGFTLEGEGAFLLSSV